MRVNRRPSVMAREPINQRVPTLFAPLLFAHEDELVAPAGAVPGLRLTEAALLVEFDDLIGTGDLEWIAAEPVEQVVPGIHPAARIALPARERLEPDRVAGDRRPPQPGEGRNEQRRLQRLHGSVLISAQKP